MSDDNGAGSGGGNSSVWWEMRGSRSDLKKPKLANSLSISGVGMGSGQAVVDVADMVNHPGPGEVKIGSTQVGEGCVHGHDTTDFDLIGVSKRPGVPSHAGKFRVSLRFRKQDLKNRKLISEAYESWILQAAERSQQLTGKPADTSQWTDDDVYIVLDVPAIRRKPMPKDGGAWPDQPWEIHWEW